MRKIRLCVIVTVSMNLYSLYRDQFAYLTENGFEINTVAAPGIEHQKLREQGIESIEIKMKKKPSIFYDIYSFFKFLAFFKKNQFDIISISTPKASFVAGLAAFLTGQKRIMYTVRGRAYEYSNLFTRKFYILIEKFLCKISKKVFSISHEIKNDFIKLGICKSNKIFVIGLGSSNGVDLTKFTLNESLKRAGEKIRDFFKIDKNDVCLLYSGRIRKDKGINELVLAFKEISEEYSNVHLIIQGSFDNVDPLNPNVLEHINLNERIHLASWCRDVERYFAACDIFVFPSHREGFGNVAIEASALEIPVIAFNVIGCRESVEDKVSGLLAEKIDVKLLKDTIVKLIKDQDLRQKLGKNGRKRVEKNFDSCYIWDELKKKYLEMMNDTK